MKMTYDQMEELNMYESEFEIVDTDDEDLVNIVVTIPVDRFTASEILDRARNCE